MKVRVIWLPYGPGVYRERGMRSAMRNYLGGSMNGLGSAWVGVGIMGAVLHGDWWWYVYLGVGAILWVGQWPVMFRRDGT